MLCGTIFLYCNIFSNSLFDDAVQILFVSNNVISFLLGLLKHDDAKLPLSAKKTVVECLWLLTNRPEAMEEMKQRQAELYDFVQQYEKHTEVVSILNKVYTKAYPLAKIKEGDIISVDHDSEEITIMKAPKSIPIAAIANNTTTTTTTTSVEEEQVDNKQFDDLD